MSWQPVQGWEAAHTYKSRKKTTNTSTNRVNPNNTTMGEQYITTEIYYWSTNQQNHNLRLMPWEYYQNKINQHNSNHIAEYQWYPHRTKKPKKLSMLLLSTRPPQLRRSSLARNQIILAKTTSWLKMETPNEEPNFQIPTGVQHTCWTKFKISARWYSNHG